MSDHQVTSKCQKCPCVFKKSLGKCPVLRGETTPVPRRILSLGLSTLALVNVRVVKVSCSQEPTGLVAGDILLTLGDNAVRQMSNLRDMFTLESLNMSVVRNQIEIRVNVPTVAMSSWQSDRVPWFSEAQLKQPYFPLPLCARKLYNQIFVISRRSGSPAEMYDLSVHHFITGVNGVATENFDNFTNKMKKLVKNSYCQITLISLQGFARTVPLMPNGRDLKTVDARRKRKESYNWEFQEL